MALSTTLLGSVTVGLAAATSGQYGRPKRLEPYALTRSPKAVSAPSAATSRGKAAGILIEATLWLIK